MELTTLCYIHRESNKPEDRTYYETVGDYGKSHFRTKDISEAMFKPANAWEKTIAAEYADHITLWYDQIILVYVEVKEVIKDGWTEYKYIRTIREGEDLLAKYKDRRKTLMREVEEITLDFPVFEGQCYLIRSRQDLANLVELYPFNWMLSEQLYEIEKTIRIQAADENSEDELVEYFRNNFYLPGDICHDRIELPAVIRVYTIDGDKYCSTYTLEELRTLFETCKKTFETKLLNLKEN